MPILKKIIVLLLNNTSHNTHNVSMVWQTLSNMDVEYMRVHKSEQARIGENS